MNRLALLLSALGLYLLVATAGELDLARHASSSPVELSCAEALSESDRAGPWVVLLRCRLCVDREVAQISRQGAVTKTWIPLALEDGVCPALAGTSAVSVDARDDSGPARLVLATSGPSSLLRQVAPLQLEGVLEPLDEMPHEVKKRFYGALHGEVSLTPPGWILRYEERPWSWFVLVARLSGALVLLAAGLFGPALLATTRRHRGPQTATD